MTVDEVRERVEVIRQIAFDDEAAHCKESELYSEVLTAIAKGADSPDKLAAEALKTEKIEFFRWFG
ncbi:hypothetical protein FO510_05415 [Bacillus pumilus]|uniref:hypothetical protein n=1 Tax=Bacillus pumilus TaxID=1408 RepID=UPI000553FA5B|nr:hypothetical protein [Bacillus pumilus]MCR4352197.1 hypothetical protein [Bacillus pumilus]MCY7504008.1 hypothetical protein [Bacillus pumilus]MDR4269003.1 hypothetical protein [Bacillus pumilus]MDR4269090.1 hypothetical protein [Bacillus pumilus]MED4724293.1 hypothetical protein [Bacillus pumilus]